MKKFLFVIAFLGSLLLFGILSHAEEEISFKVIINASNPDSVLMKEDVSKLFLKKIKNWETSGKKVQPVDLLVTSPVRKKFSEDIHGKKVGSIKAYWQKQIFSGRGIPPPEVESDDHVLEYVQEHIDAIGYVSESTKIDKFEVKVIEIVEKK